MKKWINVFCCEVDLPFSEVFAACEQYRVGERHWLSSSWPLQTPGWLYRLGYKQPHRCVWGSELQRRERCSRNKTERRGCASVTLVIYFLKPASEWCSSFNHRGIDWASCASSINSECKGQPPTPTSGCQKDIVLWPPGPPVDSGDHQCTSPALSLISWWHHLSFHSQNTKWGQECL